MHGIGFFIVLGHFWLRVWIVRLLLGSGWSTTYMSAKYVSSHLSVYLVRGYFMGFPWVSEALFVSWLWCYLLLLFSNEAGVPMRVAAFLSYRASSMSSLGFLFQCHWDATAAASISWKQWTNCKWAKWANLHFARCHNNKQHSRLKAHIIFCLFVKGAVLGDIYVYMKGWWGPKHSQVRNG